MGTVTSAAPVPRTRDPFPDAGGPVLTCGFCVPVVSVDLSSGSMAPGGRGYQRLLTGLRSRLPMKADFLLSHHPGRCCFPPGRCASTSGSFCLVPLGGGASLQSLLSRYDWTEHRPEVSRRALAGLSCPGLLTSDLQPGDSHSVLEWLGAVDAGVDAAVGW